jgi:hypothetical protein
LWLGSISGAAVSENYLLNSDNNPALIASLSAFGASQPIVVQASQNVATGNNTIDRTSGRMWITDRQYRELAAYAPGSTVRLNAYDIGTIRNPGITLTDADGQALTASIQVITSHFIDVQIPASAALGGAYLSLSSGSLRYFGTLFLDSVDNVPALNGCTYEVSPSSNSVGSADSNLPVLVVTQTGCPFQATAADGFVSGGPIASGTNVISLGFAPNPAGDRTTTIEVAGQPITVTRCGRAAQFHRDLFPSRRAGFWTHAIRTVISEGLRS